jgi:CBS-domain-containing membrane protein
VNATEWALLAGTLVPLVVGVINRYYTLSSTVRGWAAAIGSLILAVGTVYFAGGLNPGAIVTTILAVYGAGQAAYRFIFKPFGWTADCWEDPAKK